MVGLGYVRASHDGYVENGPSPFNATVRANAADSLTSEFGVRATTQLNTALGQVTPELRLAWLHDFSNGKLLTQGLMGGVPFSVGNSRIAADGARVNLAATLRHTDRITFRAEYEGDIRSNYNAHAGLLRVSYGF